MKIFIRVPDGHLVICQRMLLFTVFISNRSLINILYNISSYASGWETYQISNYLVLFQHHISTLCLDLNHIVHNVARDVPYFVRLRRTCSKSDVDQAAAQEFGAWLRPVLNNLSDNGCYSLCVALLKLILDLTILCSLVFSARAFSAGYNNMRLQCFHYIRL